MMKIRSAARPAFRLLALSLLCLLLLPTLAACKKEADPADFVLPVRTIAEDAPILEYGLFDYQVYDDGTVILVTYKGDEKNVTIPDTIDGKPVVELGAGLFSGKMNLETAKLGKNVEILGTLCFVDCTALYEITFNDKVWSIGTYAFYNTPWLATQSDEFVVVGDGVLVKYNGSAANVRLPDNVKHVVDAFEYYEKLVSLEMSDNLLTIGEYAFAYCSSLTSVRFSKNLRKIGNYAFNECSALTALNLPDTLEVIDSFAFNYCGSLSYVDFGNSLTSIGMDAFYNCVRLACVTIPKTLTFIDSYAFSECYSLSLVYFGGTEEEFRALVEARETNFRLGDANVVYNAERAS